MTPVTLAEMRDVAAAEARRIEVTQEALVEASLRVAQCEEQLRKRDAYDAIVRLIDAVKARPAIMEELRGIAASQRGARP